MLLWGTVHWGLIIAAAARDRTRLEWVATSMTNSTRQLIEAAKAVAQRPDEVPVQAKLVRVCAALSGMALGPGHREKSCSVA